MLAYFLYHVLLLVFIFVLLFLLSEKLLKGTCSTMYLSLCTRKTILNLLLSLQTLESFIPISCALKIISPLTSAGRFDFQPHTNILKSTQYSYTDNYPTLS